MRDLRALIAEFVHCTLALVAFRIAAVATDNLILGGAAAVAVLAYGLWCGREVPRHG